MVLITVKCASVECRQLPEINGYCAPCWHSRKRSELTDQERSKRYRERMREKQRTRRARKKGASNATMDTAREEYMAVENSDIEQRLPV